MKKHNKIFMGDGLKTPDKYINKLNKIKIYDNFYIVVITDNNNLEIYHSLLFMQKFYKNTDFTVVAICKSKESCFEYIRRITALSYKKYNKYIPIECIDSLDEYDIDYLYDDLFEEQE